MKLRAPAAGIRRMWMQCSIGMSAPITQDYLDRITAAAGIRPGALKVAVHKACDGSVSSLHLALNPSLPENKGLRQNIAESLRGKKVLVGGIEGLSRFLNKTATQTPCSYSETPPASLA